jgi:hypothetical protein
MNFLNIFNRGGEAIPEEDKLPGPEKGTTSDEEVLANKQIQFEELLMSRGKASETDGSFPTEKVRVLILDEINKELQTCVENVEYCDQLEAFKRDLETEIGRPQDLMLALKTLPINKKTEAPNAILKWAKEISE